MELLVEGFVGRGLVGICGDGKYGEEELWAGESEAGEDGEIVGFDDAVELWVDFVGAGCEVGAVGVEEAGEYGGEELGGQ